MSHGPKHTRDWKATLPKKTRSPSRRGSVLFEGRGSEHATAKELPSYHWTDDISTRWLMNYRGIAWLSHLNHRMTREALEQPPYWISMNYKQHTFSTSFQCFFKVISFPQADASAEGLLFLRLGALRLRPQYKGAQGLIFPPLETFWWIVVFFSVVDFGLCVWGANFAWTQPFMRWAKRVKVAQQSDIWLAGLSVWGSALPKLLQDALLSHHPSLYSLTTKTMNSEQWFWQPQQPASIPCPN